MEHINIEQLPDGFVKLTAAEGYRLLHIYLQRFFSEAVIHPEDIGNFTAIAE